MDGRSLNVVFSEQDCTICIVNVCEQALSDVDTCLVCTYGRDPINGNRPGARTHRGLKNTKTTIFAQPPRKFYAPKTIPVAPWSNTENLEAIITAVYEL